MLDPYAVQRVLQEARLATRGESREILAVLQAAYLEEVIRLAIAEQPSGRQLQSMEAFCAVAGHKLIDEGASYRRESLGRVHNAQDQAWRFGNQLLQRLALDSLTRAPSEDDDAAIEPEPADDFV